MEDGGRELRCSPSSIHPILNPQSAIRNPQSSFSSLRRQRIMIERMNVRLGTSGDWPAVLPMLREHRAMHEQWDAALYALRPDAEERFKRWLGPASEDPRALLMVVEGDRGKLVGFLT